MCWKRKCFLLIVSFKYSFSQVLKYFYPPNRKAFWRTSEGNDARMKRMTVFFFKNRTRRERKASLRLKNIGLLEGGIIKGSERIFTITPTFTDVPSPSWKTKILLVSVKQTYSGWNRKASGFVCFRVEAQGPWALSARGSSCSPVLIFSEDTEDETRVLIGVS